jgi:type IV pilus assembly protein PilC
MSEMVYLVNNAYLEKGFSNAVEKVKKGEDIDVVLKDMRIFPPLFIRLVKIGQTAGHLDEMLERSAVIFDEEVDRAINQITLSVEPVLIIILSMVVGIILLSVMLPMIGIMNAIG